MLALIAIIPLIPYDRLRLLNITLGPNDYITFVSGSKLSPNDYIHQLFVSGSNSSPLDATYTYLFMGLSTLHQLTVVALVTVSHWRTGKYYTIPVIYSLMKCRRRLSSQRCILYILDFRAPLHYIRASLRSASLLRRVYLTKVA